MCIARNVIVLPSLEYFRVLMKPKTKYKIVSSLFGWWRKSHTELVSRFGFKWHDDELPFHYASAFNSLLRDVHWKSSSLVFKGSRQLQQAGEEIDWLDRLLDLHLSWLLIVCRRRALLYQRSASRWCIAGDDTRHFAVRWGVKSSVIVWRAGDAVSWHQAV